MEYAYLLPMKARKPAILIFCVLICISAFSQDWKVYPYTPEGSFISFPADEGRHPGEPVEWWYTTGHLTGETSGRTYSYMLSYFYSPVSAFDGFRILNVSDDGSGEFFSDTKALVYTVLATDSLNIEAELLYGATEYWYNRTDYAGNALPFSYVLSAEGDNASLQLDYDANKPPLVLADSGLLDQGPEAYTYYYSLTGNDVSGSISFDGFTENVSGDGWIDRQYGTINPSEGLEYEWFSIQLSNGMDINMNNIFTTDNSLPGTLDYRLMCVYVDENTQFTGSSFQVDRLAYEYTPDSLRCYSTRWRLTSGFHGIDLIISVLNPAYEVSLPFRFYEGPVSISGTVDGASVEGKGFAELLHSYDKPDITIDNRTNIGEEATVLKWQLNNPDDGNPLKYDLEYSTDGSIFQPLAGGLEDTVYYWDSSHLAEENDTWLKVKGFSVDTTLVDSSSVKLVSVTAVEDVENETEVNIFPNPGDGHFTVQGENIREILVFDIHGGKVFSSAVNTGVWHIDISDKASGMYFVKIVMHNNSFITRKLIKE